MKAQHDASRQRAHEQGSHGAKETRGRMCCQGDKRMCMNEGRGERGQHVKVTTSMASTKERQPGERRAGSVCSERRQRAL